MQPLEGFLKKELFVIYGVHVTVFTALLVALLVWFVFYRKRGG